MILGKAHTLRKLTNTDKNASLIRTKSNRGPHSPAPEAHFVLWKTKPQSAHCQVCMYLDNIVLRKKEHLHSPEHSMLVENAAIARPQALQYR